MKFLNETRVAHPFSMNKFCPILVCMGINLKLLTDFLVSLTTSNFYFEMSDSSLSLKQRFYFMYSDCSIFISVGVRL